MKILNRYMRKLSSLLLSLSFCLFASTVTATDTGDQLFIPIGVGDITIFVPILGAPGSVAVTEQSQTGGESVYQISWQAVGNAAYYQIDVTDEDGAVTSVTTTDLNYALSGLPLGASTAVLLACNSDNQCGAGANLGTYSVSERIRYMVADILGSPILEADQAGNVLSESHYKPFGETEEAKKEDIGYTGHMEDTDLGLTYMQARYYDPVIGRFLSNDPVGFVAHVRSTQGPQGFNRYAYVNNNPYKFTDPEGELAILAWFATPPGQAALVATGKWAAGGAAAIFAYAATDEVMDNVMNNDSAEGSESEGSEQGDSETSEEGKSEEGRQSPDRQALGEIIREETLGGRMPLSGEDADTVLDWANEVGAEGSRDDRGTDHWEGGEHIHVPGSGVRHIPVD